MTRTNRFLQPHARRISVTCTLAILLLAYGAHSHPASAAETIWINPLGGLFDTQANWSNGFPFGTLEAKFDLAAAYTVTLTSNASSARLIVNGGDVRLHLSGRTYGLSNAVWVGDSTDKTGQLTLRNGALNAGSIEVGRDSADTGQLIIDTAASVTNTNATIVGQSGQGTLSIQNGGRLIDGSAIIGRDATALATATVTGAGSQWTTGTLQIGRSGNGTLNVSGGGRLVSGIAQVGALSGGTGRIAVLGNNSLWTITQAFTIGDQGSGSLTIDDGGTVESQSSTTLGSSFGANGNVVVQGVGSRWTIADTLLIANAGTAQLSILDGAEVTSGAVHLSSAGTSQSTVRISGINSRWTVDDGLYLGGALSAGGAAELRVETGATLVTGTRSTAPLKVWDNGRLIIAGGTLQARHFIQRGTLDFRNGTLRISGGQFDSGNAFTVDGDNLTALPTLELLAGATTNNLSSLTIADIRQAKLLISGGAAATVNGDVILGRNVGSHSEVVLEQNGLLSAQGIVGVGGTATGSGGSAEVAIRSHAQLNAANAVRLWPGGTLHLDGGLISAAQLQFDGGQFNFSAGTLRLTSPAIATQAWLAGVLGPSRTLIGSQTLDLAGMTLNAPLVVNGGSLISQSSTNNSLLDLKSGTIAITGSSTNGAPGLLSIANGANASFAQGLINHGEIELVGSTALLQGGLLVNQGTVLGRGRIAMSLDNREAGEVRAVDGDRLVFQGLSNVSVGRIEASTGAEIEFTSSLTNGTGGLLNARDATLRFRGGLINDGAIALTTGIASILGDVQNNVTGRAVISGNATVIWNDDLVNQGIVQVTTGSTAIYLGSVTGAGAFTGGGTNAFLGDLRPGNSPGVVAFAGNVQLGSTNNLQIEIGGTIAETQHDRLVIAGNAELGGTLDLRLINGHRPVAGDRFQILQFSQRSGMFNSITQPTGASPVQLVPIYGATDVTLFAVKNGVKTWALDADGPATAPTNWFGGTAPNAAGERIAFTTVATANRRVTLVSPLTVSEIEFDDDNNYTISGPETLTFQQTGSTAARLSVQGTHGHGTHAIDTTTRLASDLIIDHQSNADLLLTGTLQNELGKLLVKTGSGTIELQGSQHWGDGARIHIEQGTFRFALPETATTQIGENAAALVDVGATLELAGDRSALCDSLSVPDQHHHADIENHGALLVSGAHQSAGEILGTGMVTLSADTDLTVDRIVQRSLVIGAGAKLTIRPDGRIAAALTNFEGTNSDSVTAVPEPPTMVLLLLALLIAAAIHGTRRRC